MVMAVALPTERVYYYECSAGRFRLFCFIPAAELARLCDEHRIAHAAVVDYPDGVNLECTELSFSELQSAYGYRPPQDPEALRRTFLAMLTSTRGWRRFRGAGLVPAAELESRLASVEEAVRSRAASHEAPARSTTPQQEGRRRSRSHRAVRHQGVARALDERALERMQVDGVDPRRSLPDQAFSRIEWGEGADAAGVFLELHQQGQKGG
jgi:hypothetical protein